MSVYRKALVQTPSILRAVPVVQAADSRADRQAGRQAGSLWLTSLVERPRDKAVPRPGRQAAIQKPLSHNAQVSRADSSR